MAKRNPLTQAKKSKADSLVHEGRLEAAREIYQRVCQKDLFDVEAWVKLGEISRRLGDYGNAETSFRSVIALSPNFSLAHQMLATVLQCQGRVDDAIDEYRKAIQLNPIFPDGYYLLGNALIEKGLMSEGAECCLRALDLRPDFFEALSDLGSAFLFLGRREEATDILQRALKMRPDSPVVLANLACLKEMQGRVEEALEYYALALRVHPDSVEILAKQAELMEKTGRLAEASDLVARGLRINETLPLLHLVSARLERHAGRYANAAILLEAIRKQAMPHDLAGESLLLLGQIYDRLGEYEKVFPLLFEGKCQVALATHSTEENTKHVLERIDAARLWLGSSAPVPANININRMDAPVFLLGFPRSGTTLLEQILDSHPGIQALDEKPMSGAMEQAFLNMTGGAASSLAQLDEQQLAELRKVYFDEADKQVTRRPNTLLLDKLPLNSLRVPLLWRVFPSARFILAIRHPCDVCLSCYMQNFATNDIMKSFISLETIATIYARAMGAWQEYVVRLPLIFHRIRYEDLVANLEPEVRGLLQFLELGWNDSVLGHTQHAQLRDIINTPSYHQVTQPIYQHAKYRWKHYEHEFAPVMDTLRPYISSFGYSW
jgi:tetratricopeptide (TPR) repeat protein